MTALPDGPLFYVDARGFVRRWDPEGDARREAERDARDAAHAANLPAWVDRMLALTPESARLMQQANDRPRQASCHSTGGGSPADTSPSSTSRSTNASELALDVASTARSDASLARTRLRLVTPAAIASWIRKIRTWCTTIVRSFTTKSGAGDCASIDGTPQGCPGNVDAAPESRKGRAS